MEQAVSSVWVESYRQIQARSGSHWALDIPMALGEDTAPSGHSGLLLRF